MSDEQLAEWHFCPMCGQPWNGGMHKAFCFGPPPNCPTCDPNVLTAPPSNIPEDYDCPDCSRPLVRSGEFVGGTRGLARLDADGSAKPRTKLVAHVQSNKRIGPTVNPDQYVASDGTRVSLGSKPPKKKRLSDAERHRKVEAVENLVTGAWVRLLAARDVIFLSEVNGEDIFVWEEKDTSASLTDSAADLVDKLRERTK